MREDDAKHQTDETFFKPKYGRNEARDRQRSRIFDTIVAHCYTHAEFQAAWQRRARGRSAVHAICPIPRLSPPQAVPS